MAKPVLLKKAEFNPRLKTYLNLYGAFMMLVMIFTIPFIPLWLIIAPVFINKYFERLECELTTRSLRFKKGFLVQIEKTVPLDKIQDLTFKEGPLLRMLGLSILKVETAGNSGTGVADLSLLGVVDAMEFRQMVFDQRDKVTDNANSGDTSSESMIEILSDIRDSIKSIEQRLAEK
ncbi:MAG: PH domain-containing protein [Balneolaceae bacterium]|nr:PH domain-containing protein [Balneolaceae bacterium]